MSNNSGLAGIILAALLLTAAPASLAFAQGAGGEPVAPQGEAVQPAPGEAVQPVPGGEAVPANPQAANPAQPASPAQEGGYEMAVPDNYVAEPQVNMAPQVQLGVDNNYPTVAIADYVFGCMASNGQTRTALNACSCSIDVISSILPYEQYIEAETTLGVRQVGGEKAEIFRTQDVAENLLNLRRAQAEAEIRCF